MKIGKKEFYQKVAEHAKFDSQWVPEVCNGFIDALMDCLKNRDEVSIPGFGTFSLRYYPEREGKNPQTGEPITIAASYSPVFKAGKTFKQRVNEVTVDE